MKIETMLEAALEAREDAAYARYGKIDIKKTPMRLFKQAEHISAGIIRRYERLQAENAVLFVEKSELAVDVARLTAENASMKARIYSGYCAACWPDHQGGKHCLNCGKPLADNDSPTYAALKERQP